MLTSLVKQSSRFCIMDQSEAFYILGLTIKHDRQKHCLWNGQAKYFHLHCFGMKDYNPGSTPLDVSHRYHHLSTDEEAFNREI